MFRAQHLARSPFPVARHPKRNDGGAREIQLGEAPFDATRVARFLRAPDGALRVALVNTSTGAEFGSLPLAERSQAELARVMAIVKTMRDRATAKAEPAPVAPPRSFPRVVRVWVKKSEWEALEDEALAKFREPIAGTRLVWVRQFDYDDYATTLVYVGDPLSAIEGIAETYGVTMTEGDRPRGMPPPKKPAPPTPLLADAWNVAEPGDLVRWEPVARLFVQGVKAVEGTLATAIGVAKGTRFTKIDLGGKTVQVQEKDGRLRVLARPAGAPVSLADSPTPRPPREAAPVRTPKPSPLDAAGLATPKRVTPAPGWKGPPESIKALQAVETVMPLLPSRAVFGPARRLVAEFRAWIETGVDQRDTVGGDRETWDAAMRKEADFVQEAVLNAVQWLRHDNFGNHPAHAYENARRLAATLRFDAAGGNYAERMAKATNDPIYLRWYGENPHFGLPLPPSPQEAIERVTQMVAESSEGWTVVAPEQRERVHNNGSSTLAREWENITRGYAPALLKQHAGMVLSGKGYVLDALTRAERTGREPERLTESENIVSRALQAYGEVLLLDTAFRAGLRSPADAARPALQAQVDAIVAKQDAITNELSPRVEAILHRAGAELAALAVSASEAFEAARARDKTLRVPQTADVAQLLRASLEEYAASLMAGRDTVVKSLGELEGIAGENWASSLRRVPQGGWTALVPSTGAAYVDPALRTIRDVAERPAAWIAIRAMQAIGYPDAVALAQADRLRDHYSRNGRFVGPWEPLHHKPDTHNIRPRWKEFSGPSSRPRSLWGRGGEE